MNKILIICFSLYLMYFIFRIWKGYIEKHTIIRDFKFVKKFKKNPGFSTLHAIYLLGQKYGYENVYKTLKHENFLDDKDLALNNKVEDI